VYNTAATTTHAKSTLFEGLTLVLSSLLKIIAVILLQSGFIFTARQLIIQTQHAELSANQFVQGT
jgi:hypothetical protein